MTMNFISNNKNVAGGVALILIIGSLYYMFFSGGSSSPALTSTDQNSPVSQDLLNTLQRLHTIKLDSSVFSNPVFVSLTDFGVTIPPENVGRRNPFVPLTGVTKSSSLTLPSGH